MRAWTIHEHGGPEVLTLRPDAPVSEPGPGEVRIALRACALNHLDTWVRRGLPGVTFPLPMILGCDGAGRVDAWGSGAEEGAADAGVELAVGAAVGIAPGIGCGDCKACASGDDHLCRRYGILGETRDGTCAEFVCVPAKNLLPGADAVGWEAAAATPLVFLTAWQMLIGRAGLRSGESVLVHAAGSGVSTAAISIAQHHGARVMATAGSGDKCAKALALGCERAVNYREDDWGAAAREWTDKRGLDVVIDHVGADTMPTSILSLGRGGRVVSCGNTSGPIFDLDMRHVFFKSLSVLGSTMGPLGALRDAWALVVSGDLVPTVSEVFDFDDLPTAHARMGERDLFGKLVVRISAD